MLRYNTLTGDQFMITTPMNNPSAIVYIFQRTCVQFYKVTTQLFNTSKIILLTIQTFVVTTSGLMTCSTSKLGSIEVRFSCFFPLTRIDFYAHYLEIEWDEQSYLANKDDYPSLNYTLIKLSSGTQGTADFPTTNPHDKVRY